MRRAALLPYCQGRLIVALFVVSCAALVFVYYASSVRSVLEPLCHNDQCRRACELSSRIGEVSLCPSLALVLEFVYYNM